MLNLSITITLLTSILIILTNATTLQPRALGASTPLSSKSTLCNIITYGAVADNKTDISTAITTAFSQCVKGHAATLYIPPGSYSLAKGVILSGASGWALRLDGLITLTQNGAFNGNAFVIENGNDIEIYSSNNQGAINGQGYLTRISQGTQNARLMRFISVSNLSVHNLILVDSPTFHLIFNEVSNLEAYYLTIRGPDIGGTDGIDLICTSNCYIHDFEVTNRDECVSVKSPSANVLIENAYCNHSGGMSIGSLTADITSASQAAAVENVTMRNVYSYQSTQMLMIKTFPGGSGAEGYVRDSTFEGFWSYDCTYGLDIDQYWESHTTPDTGAVALSGLTFTNWTGHIDNGLTRGPVVIRGSDKVPLTDITLSDIDMWTLNGKEIVNQCKNVYGEGSCVRAVPEGAGGEALPTYASSQTVTVAPTAYVSPTKPTWAVEGYGTTVAIPVYTPSVWWPVAEAKATGV